LIRPHPTVPLAWELSADDSFSGPYVGVIGALHGNETAGLRALERLRGEAQEFARRMQRGTVVLIHGNPLASEQQRRHSEGGTDINRLFKYDYVDSVAPEAWTFEHRRALELRPLVTGLDALLDLHSASRPTKPFAICDGRPAGIDLARRTGCLVTYGWDGPGMLMDHVSIGSLVTQGRPALSVECGQHDDAATVDNAWTVLTRFLGSLGITDHPASPELGPVFRLFARVVKPTHTFQLAQPFNSFDRLAPGELLGRGEGVTISLDEEAYLLLPTPNAVRGEDLVYLAKREDV